MIRSLYTLALKILMEKYSCTEIREGGGVEIQEIRRCMLNNHRFVVNYRTLECINQLHYFTDSPAEILKEIDNMVYVLDIGMSDIDF